MQVLTSCAAAFAHGANDVANSVGPFAAIYAIYQSGTVSDKSEIREWILVRTLLPAAMFTCPVDLQARLSP